MLWHMLSSFQLYTWAKWEDSKCRQCIFWVCREWRWRRGFFIFLMFPMCSQWVPMTLTLCSHQVLIMFPIIFHDVLNMFFKFPLYSLTHSQEHLTFIPYGLANVVLFSFMYIIKVVWFALWHWDLQNHHVLNCILGIFGKLLMSKVHRLGFIVFGIAM